MAISATCAVEVRTGGSDNNGGLFNASGSSPGTDMSQQNAAQVFIDGATISATVHTTTTQITIVGYTVSAADNRNGLQITGGTATAGFYEIVAVDVPNNRWQLDRAVGTSTQTVVGRMGGGLATPGKAAGVVSGTGCDVWMQSGNYLVTTTSANVANGRVQTAGSSTDAQRWEGYQTTRGDRAARAVLKASGNNGFTLFTGTNNCEICNIETDGNGQTTIVGFATTGLDRFFYCVARSCATGYSFAVANASFINCRAITCGNGFSGNGPLIFCQSETCTTAGFSSTGAIECFFCIDDSSAIGFNVTSTPLLAHCIAYGGTGNGITFGNSGQAIAINCIAYGKTGTGFNTGSSRNNKLINCAGGGNSVADQNNTQAAIFVEGFITLTADPFTNAAGDDFSLNNTSGGGALLRQAGYPTTYQNGTLQYLDVGAAQVQTAAAASTYNTVIASDGINA